MRSWLPLGLVLVAFLVLATAYNIRVPLYESPDEPQHVGYVDALQQTGRIPEITPTTYMAYQPPFYHALGAGLLKLLRLDPPLLPVDRNPNFPQERNRFVHQTDEGFRFPYSGPALSIHVLRGLTTLFGLGTIVFIYLTALVLFPERRLLALTAAATTALLPQFAFISGMVTNDSAASLFAAATVYFGIRFLRDGGQVWLLAAAVAVSFGALTKSSPLVAGLVPGLALFLRPMPWRQRGQGAALLIAAPLAVAGWFYVRNLVLWGDINASEQLHEAGLLPSLPIWDPFYRRAFLDSMTSSYWYKGGWLSVVLSPLVYNALDLVSGLALGGLIALGVSGRLSSFQRRGLLLLALLIPAMLVGILIFSTTVNFQAQGRFLFVAQSALAILLPLGLSALFSRDHTRDHPAIVVLPLILMALNISIFLINLPRAY